jgi:hypothetical protein
MPSFSGASSIGSPPSDSDSSSEDSSSDSSAPAVYAASPVGFDGGYFDDDAALSPSGLQGSSDDDDDGSYRSDSDAASSSGASETQSPSDAEASKSTSASRSASSGASVPSSQQEEQCIDRKDLQTIKEAHKSMGTLLDDIYEKHLAPTATINSTLYRDQMKARFREELREQVEREIVEEQKRGKQKKKTKQRTRDKKEPAKRRKSEPTLPAAAEKMQKTSGDNDDKDEEDEEDDQESDHNDSEEKVQKGWENQMLCLDGMSNNSISVYRGKAFEFRLYCDYLDKAASKSKKSSSDGDNNNNNNKYDLDTWKIYKFMFYLAFREQRPKQSNDVPFNVSEYENIMNNIYHKLVTVSTGNVEQADDQQRSTTTGTKYHTKTPTSKRIQKFVTKKTSPENGINRNIFCSYKTVLKNIHKRQVLDGTNKRTWDDIWIDPIFKELLDYVATRKKKK